MIRHIANLRQQKVISPLTNKSQICGTAYIHSLDTHLNYAQTLYLIHSDNIYTIVTQNERPREDAFSNFKCLHAHCSNILVASIMGQCQMDLTGQRKLSRDHKTWN